MLPAMKRTSTKTKTGRPARTDKPQKLNLAVSLAAKRRAAGIAKSQGTSISSLFERLLGDAPDEPQIAYVVQMPLSLFKRAEKAARFDRQPLNEYIVRGIVSDLENFEESDENPGELTIPYLRKS